MWTAENRGRYDPSRLRYPSDLTDEEWALIAPLLIIVPLAIFNKYQAEAQERRT